MTDNPPDAKPLVRFHYIKSNFFRVVHVDGALGGLTGLGGIHCALYSERPAIPRVTEHEVIEDSLGPPVKAEGRDGFVRELEVDLMLSRDKAIELRNWLNDRIEEIEKVFERAKEKE